MCNFIAAAIGGLSLLGGVAGSIVNGAKAAKQAKKAQKANEAQAAADAQRSEEQFNKANQKVPDILAMFDSNSQAARTGMGGTFLTGPAGVDNSLLTLGKSSLLGG